MGVRAKIQNKTRGAALNTMNFKRRWCGALRDETNRDGCLLEGARDGLKRVARANGSRLQKIAFSKMSQTKKHNTYNHT